jgi:hypothetical protein
MMGMPHFTENINSLERRFSSLGIPFDEPGFYDHSNFLSEEQTDPYFLNCYASYVRQRSYDEEYANRVRRIVHIVSNILHRELVAEGRLGACVDLSMVLSRVLEKEGILNYCVNGALTINFPERKAIPTQFFWPLDIGVTAGHVWVAAPPFQVIDLTINRQPFERRMKAFVPDMWLIEESEKCRATVEDICSAEFLYENYAKGIRSHELHSQLTTTLRDISRRFPGVQVQHDGATYKYFVWKSSASDKPLDEITNQRWNGRYGKEIYRDLIRPALVVEGL